MRGRSRKAGLADFWLPPFQEAAHWLHQNIKGARLEWLSPAKHASVLEQPQDFANFTRAFLES